MEKPPKHTEFGIVSCFMCFLLVGLSSQVLGQTININGTGPGRTFDGVGGVSGGGATSVLLMSYVEPQRSQILDFLFKPNFGASISTHFSEVPGDANSTQGSELSHMHTKTDLNCQRGYEWFLIKEAYKRNPTITFDAVAWGCPGWVGNRNFWSTDMQDYYVKWIQGLKSIYGINLDAIGGRNESGTNTGWLKQFHTALNAANLSSVRLHGMDDWNGVDAKWGLANGVGSDASLKEAIDVLSAHTTVNSSWSECKIDATGAALNSGKPLWDTEEHYMNQYSGYAQATAVVNGFNLNYIKSKVTKTLFWYLIDCTYPVEPYGDHGCMRAQEPWSGNYVVKPGVWGYAHYGQFTKIGWKFIDGACGTFGGGTYCTLRSPDNSDFSVIIETKGGGGGSTLNFTISGGLPTDKTLCVWRTTESEQFVKQADITPENGSFSLKVDGNAIYSISTTTGQQKGSFPNIPASAKFPLPYFDDFDHYGDLKSFGHLPYYFADIDGAFELVKRPDGNGACYRQMLQEKPQGWAPLLQPFTIIGDRSFRDYEVSADISFDNGGYAGVLGRVNEVGGGYGVSLRGDRFTLSSNGGWSLNGASGSVALSGTWHNVKMRLSGSTLTGFIDNKQVGTSGSGSSNGMAGLITSGYNSALFDNFLINTVDGPAPTTPTALLQDKSPPYPPPIGVIEKAETILKTRPVAMTYRTVGPQFFVPKELTGKNIAVSIYILNGALAGKVTTKSSVIDLRDMFGKSNELFIVKLKVLQ